MTTILVSTELGIFLGEVARRRVAEHRGVRAIRQNLQRMLRMRRNDGLAQNYEFHQLQWGCLARDGWLEDDVECR